MPQSEAKRRRPTDNHQHGPDENLRVQNLWDGIAICAALVARLDAEWDARESTRSR